ncbi:hypothetical protein PIB30_043479 [Stylosanthes scabra]|uniref:Uncharacterized protein n=1 Tax=Stylosanthes scabra TaxID=79078 RepID=A0ABU6ZEB6_9FABA|nr:hypothetical protein [Stylosanthes scabra]
MSSFAGASTYCRCSSVIVCPPPISFVVAARQSRVDVAARSRSSELVTSSSPAPLVTSQSPYVNRKFSNQYKATIGAAFIAKEVQFEDRLFTLHNIARPCSNIIVFLKVLWFFWLVHLILKTSCLLSWGNKIDVEGGNSRVISEKKAKAWCASKGNMPYFETSAKGGFNVEAAFQCIAKMHTRTNLKKKCASVSCIHNLFLSSSIGLLLLLCVDNCKRGC